MPYPYPTGFQYPTAPVRVLPAYNKPWVLCKHVLTGLSLCWAIIIFSLAILFTVQEGYGSLVGIYALPISIVAMGWNAAELITFFVRSRKLTGNGDRVRRGIHPGAHVGLHLVLWLACVFGVLMALMQLISVARWTARCGDYVDDDDDDDYYYNPCTSYYIEDWATMGSYLPAYRAYLAVWCLALINHFVLFVLACIDTHQRNRMRPNNVVYGPPIAAPYGPPAPGMVPLAYYPAPPPPQQAYMASAPGALAPESKTPVAPQQQLQDYQNLAGFYAPRNSPAAHTPPRASPPQPAAAPGPGENEITAASPRP